MITKEQFLNGVEFSLNGYLGTSFKLSDDKTYLIKQSRIGRTGKIILEDYECNIEKVGNKYVSYFASVVAKSIKGKFSLEEATEYVMPEV